MRQTWKDERAEAGIGSMIIFIAIILVSAVGASMLINIAMQAQQKAEDVGQQTIADVSSGFKIISVIGDRNVDSNDSSSPSGSIQVVSIRVGLIAGSGYISLQHVAITVLSGDKSASLTFNSSGVTAADADATTFVAKTIRDDDGSLSRDIITSGDMVELIFSTDIDATNILIDEDSQISIKIIPEHGIVARIDFVAPSVFEHRYVELR